MLDNDHSDDYSSGHDATTNPTTMFGKYSSVGGAGGQFCAASFRRGGLAKRIADIDKFMIFGREWIVESGVCEW